MDERLCGWIALFFSFFFFRTVHGRWFFGFEVAETEVVSWSWIVIEAGRKKEEDTRLRHDFEIREFFTILFFSFSYSFKRSFKEVKLQEKFEKVRGISFCSKLGSSRDPPITPRFIDRV